MKRRIWIQSWSRSFTIETHFFYLFIFIVLSSMLLLNSYAHFYLRLSLSIMKLLPQPPVVRLPHILLSLSLYTLYIHLLKNFLWKIKNLESWHKKCNQKNLWLLSYEFKPYTFNVSSFYWYNAIYVATLFLYFIFAMHFFLCISPFKLSNGQNKFHLAVLKVTYFVKFFQIVRINLLRFIIVFFLSSMLKISMYISSSDQDKHFNPFISFLVYPLYSLTISCWVFSHNSYIFPFLLFLFVRDISLR